MRDVQGVLTWGWNAVSLSKLRFFGCVSGVSLNDQGNAQIEDIITGEMRQRREQIFVVLPEQALEHCGTFCLNTAVHAV
jgi:hypothetical protein